MKFDSEIAVRTWVLGAAVGYVVNKVFGGKADDETVLALGAIAGAVYDFVAFKLKERFAKKE